MFQVGLFEFVTSQPTITAILGATRTDNTTGFFYMIGISQAQLPYMVYQRISGAPSRTMLGANAYQYSRWRFSCYAASQLQAAQLAEALKLVFAAWIGMLPDGTVVENVVQEFEADDIETALRGTIYATHVDFTFNYVDNGS